MEEFMLAGKTTEMCDMSHRGAHYTVDIEDIPMVIRLKIIELPSKYYI